MLEILIPEMDCSLGCFRIALPSENKDALYFQQLNIGKIPLKKVIQMLKEKPNGSKVCFVGDMAGELDGHMHDAFKVIGSKVFSEVI